MTVAADRTRSLPTWRSLLYVPVTSQRFISRAHERGADAIQLDLEDSVAPSQKAYARRLLPDAVAHVAGHGSDVVVRVNRPWRLLVRDLEAAVRPGVHTVALPKVESPDHVGAVSDVIAELEQDAGLDVGQIGLIAMVETPEGLFRIRDIARASARVLALTLGSEDFATAVGIAPAPDLIVGAKEATLYAARAAGVLPLGLVGTLAGYRDIDAFRKVANESARAGFVGASAIHPSQVPVLNEAFTPGRDEVALARRLLDAYDSAVAAGDGALTVDGEMVDEPMARRARILLSRAEAIAGRHGHQT